MRLIKPEWAPPANVRAYSSTRMGGVSLPPWDSLNLGTHVGDDPQHVQANRQRLAELVSLPCPPVWLDQVHGTRVLQLTSDAPSSLRADAVYTRQRGIPCVVMTADCLPVLFCSADGREVAAAHAGWRGLCQGVLEATLAVFQAPRQEIMAWLGPAIGPEVFEVGPEVRDAFLAQNLHSDAAFRRVGEKFHANIWQLARERLHRSGVRHITGGGLCTASEPTEFFSFRRDGVTGRMASLIWLI